MPQVSSRSGTGCSAVRARPPVSVATALFLFCGALACEPPEVPSPTGAATTVSRTSLQAAPGCFQVTQGPPLLDPRRSLAVTEQSILARFSFERVMNQLASQSGVAGLTGLRLFQQWWDTQNPGPGLGLGPHCDDEMVNGSATLNGYPYDCRPAPAEGALAAVDPFANAGSNPDAFIPVGLFNRFDLAPPDGEHCGEHRIVYAKRSGMTNDNDRNLIIFEAAIPNPTPSKGLAGCFPIASFWASLSTQPTQRRAALLETFYFTGLTGRDRPTDENKRPVTLAPVVHIDNFGNVGRGQIRTNQFMQPVSPRVWSLREFHIRRTCADSACTAATVVPVTVKTNPWGGLFSPNVADTALPEYHHGAPIFQKWLPARIGGLLGDDVLGFTLPNTTAFDNAQSNSSGSAENRYAVQLGAAGSPFWQALEAALTVANSSLTPDQVVLRAQTQSCAGCHQLNNAFDSVTQINNPGPVGGGLTWPASLRFVHISEQQPERVGADTRFRISAALTTSFLPARAQLLKEYLQGTVGCGRDLTAKPTLSGRTTH